MKLESAIDFTPNSDAKRATLTSIYQSMITLAGELRQSTERITVWFCSLILLLDGWLISTERTMSNTQKSIVSSGILLFGFVAFLVVRSYQTRYKWVAFVIRRINEAQRTYEENVYLRDECLFPEHWKVFGTENWKEPIFRTSYLALVIFTVFGVVASWCM